MTIHWQQFLRLAGLTALLTTRAVAAESTKGETGVRPMTGTTGLTFRSSQLAGMEVKNQTGEKIGEVNEVLLDLRSGRISCFVLSSRHLANSTDQLMAVPPGVLQPSEDGKFLTMNADARLLKSAPAFDKNRWPDFADPRWRSELDQYYRNFGGRTGGAIQESAGAELAAPSREVDNTARNKRDRSGPVTAADQSGNPADVELTRQIRRGLSGDDGLSITAKNIKIITVAGEVTLRGPVRTDEERKTIAARAEAIAGLGKVTNLLEVKSNQ